MDKGLGSPPSQYFFGISIGTEANQTHMKFLKVAEYYGTPIRHGQNGWLMFLDDHWFPPRDMEGNPLRSYTPSDLHAAFVQLGLVDAESRRQLHESGDLWFLNDQEIENPGVCENGDGTGNQPKWGKALARMNRPTIERRIIQGFHGFRDYERRWEEARKGQGPGPDRVLHIQIFVSVTGGLGNGALTEVLWLVKRCAARLHIQVKVHIIQIDLGTLYPINREVAIENRNRTMNLLRATSTGFYRDLEERDGAMEGPLFDSLLISPNAGPHCQFSTLAAQEWFIAHQCYLRFYSPMGHRLKEDAVDVEANPGRDETGAPCTGSAAGVLTIALCRNSYHTYCGNEGAALFADAVLKSPVGDVALQAEQAAAEMNLVESYSESHTIRRVTQADGNEPDMFQEARGTFSDRIASLSGVDALQTMVDSHDWVMRELIPRVQQPRMLQRTAGIVEGVRKRLAKEKSACAHDLSGLRHSRRWLEQVHHVVQESERINAEKLTALTQYGESVFQEVDACRQRVDSYRRMGFLGRLLHRLSIRALVRRTKIVSERAIGLEVERTARTMIQEQAFLPVRELLMRELAYLTLLEGKLESVAEEAHRAAETVLKAKPSPIEVPLGIGLADGMSLRSFYAGTMEKKGGEAKIIEHVGAAVVHGRVSLFTLLEQPKEQLAETLMRHAGALFEADIAALNVLDVLRERHRHAISSILSEAILDSRPWIRTTGEAARHIPVVKLLGVPQNCDEKWLLGHLKTVDHSEGEWEVVKLPDSYDAILFLTYRSRVSLTMLIGQQASSSKPGDPGSRVRNAADLLAAIIPDGKLTETDARVVTLYAQFGGLLSHDSERGWLLKAANGEAIEVGRTPQSLRAFFRGNFSDVVRVYCTLGEALRRDGKGVEEALRAMAKQWSEDATLRDALSDVALERALTEVRLLMPFVKALAGQEMRE